MDRFCYRDNIAVVPDAVTRLYRCEVEIITEAFEDGSGPCKGAEVGSPFIGVVPRMILCDK